MEIQKVLSVLEDMSRIRRYITKEELYLNIVNYMADNGYNKLAAVKYLQNASKIKGDDWGLKEAKEFIDKHWDRFDDKVRHEFNLHFLQEEIDFEILGNNASGVEVLFKAAPYQVNTIMNKLLFIQNIRRWGIKITHRVGGRITIEVKE